MKHKLLPLSIIGLSITLSAAVSNPTCQIEFSHAVAHSVQTLKAWEEWGKFNPDWRPKPKPKNKPTVSKVICDTIPLEIEQVDNTDQFILPPAAYIEPLEAERDSFIAESPIEAYTIGSSEMPVVYGGYQLVYPGPGGGVYEATVGSTVPEPGTFMLTGWGFMGLWFIFRKCRYTDK